MFFPYRRRITYPPLRNPSSKITPRRGRSAVRPPVPAAAAVRHLISRLLVGRSAESGGAEGNQAASPLVAERADAAVAKTLDKLLGRRAPLAGPKAERTCDRTSAPSSQWRTAPLTRSPRPSSNAANNSRGALEPKATSPAEPVIRERRAARRPVRAFGIQYFGRATLGYGLLPTASRFQDVPFGPALSSQAGPSSVQAGPSSAQAGPSRAPQPEPLFLSASASTTSSVRPSKPRHVERARRHPRPPRSRLRLRPTRPLARRDRPGPPEAAAGVACLPARTL
jgi:hypothetical protein